MHVKDYKSKLNVTFIKKFIRIGINCSMVLVF